MKTDSEYIEYLIQKSNHLACVCNALVAVLVEQKVCTKDDIDAVIEMYAAKQEQQVVAQTSTLGRKILSNN